MGDKISEIKKLESEPKIIKNLFNKEQINEFLNLYKSLPITVHNKKQNVIKKRWLQGFNVKLEKIFFSTSAYCTFKVSKRTWSSLLAIFFSRLLISL